MFEPAIAYVVVVALFDHRRAWAGGPPDACTRPERRNHCRHRDRHLYRGWRCASHAAVIGLHVAAGRRWRDRGWIFSSVTARSAVGSARLLAASASELGSWRSTRGTETRSAVTRNVCPGAQSAMRLYATGVRSVRNPRTRASGSRAAPRLLRRGRAPQGSAKARRSSKWLSPGWCTPVRIASTTRSVVSRPIRPLAIPSPARTMPLAPVANSSARTTVVPMATRRLPRAFVRLIAATVLSGMT